MVIQHNMQAANANRMLGLTSGSLSKSSEKLSSGYRINRAADDAAGLTISEKMRKQIKGLDQASTNAQDGISCVQTAEGALTEVHSMLQRMNELAVQASNGTMSADDRKAVQDEIDQLVTEIDRVSETTKFNEIYLLKGDGTETKTRIVGQTPMTAEYKNALTSVAALKAGVTGTDNSAFYDKGGTVLLTKDEVLAKLEVKDGAIAFKEGEALYKEAAKTGQEWGAQLTEVQLSDLTEYVVSTTALFDFTSGDEVDAEDLKDYFNEDGTYKGGLAKPKSADGTKAEVGADRIAEFVTVTAAADGTEEEYQAPKALNFSLHVGSESANANKISVKIDAMSSQGIGVDVLKGTGLTTEDGATKAIDTISSAIAKVSEQRSALGAVQNRLEHTIANLDNVVENTTAAESRIRDVDMAEEMVEYSKNNILQQAGQSMLAQANQANQGVLSLLQ
ncbi:MAG: flagellin [Butyribacter sp.]|nr:flagellin [bacterium]MDY3853409.1 flagellin [Butyribacter sp.]